jgi:hypothetical protein
MRNLWPWLKSGALARAAGIDEDAEEAVAKLAVETFTRRFVDGAPKSPLWNKSIEELLRIISENTATNAEALQFWSDASWDPPTTLLHDGASSAEITALENRLGLSLPQEYKDLLAFTNGLGASWGGYFPVAPLYEASEVKWTDIGFLGGMLPDLINIDGQSILGNFNYEGWPGLDRVIEIGSEDILCVWLLPPPFVRLVANAYLEAWEQGSEAEQRSLGTAIREFAGGMEEFGDLGWCVMTWDAGGAALQRGYPSFKAFLVDKAESSSRIDY